MKKHKMVDKVLESALSGFAGPGSRLPDPGLEP